MDYTMSMLHEMDRHLAKSDRAKKRDELLRGIGMGMSFVLVPFAFYLAVVTLFSI